MNVRAWLRSLAATVVTFTCIPIPWNLGSEDFARASQNLPLLGWAVGALQMLGLWAVRPWLDSDLALFLTLLLPIFLTGGMHEDGLADCADGLLGGYTPERRLEIMKDPRVGSYGVLALLVALPGCFLALRAIAPEHRSTILLSTAVLSRSFCLTLLPKLAYVQTPGSRSQGYLPKSMRGSAALLSLWPAAPALLILDEPRLILWVTISLWVLHVCVWRLLRRLLGGLTGDCLGASIKIAECLLLLVASVFWPANSQ